ncbi:PREDICTED: chymotrypsin-2-like [Ceratosolen solmsi marchali]|uniref:Chymotrypsin-2-like n=1 Tax=Ceratosolen solmsi marchali TaxID=326594 RepID=A0AAJ6VNC9_9HYME|nr:PREDICTED: chymotrypsin-2-like [Ceratosolen solmsi marchali]
MGFNIFSLLAVSAILCVQYNIPLINAMIGRDVHNAHIRNFPFMVAFKNINNVNAGPSRDHICSGALITTRHVLSAAQCLENRLINQTIILHGTISLVTSSPYTILWWITFNEWSNYRNRHLLFRENDISVTMLTHEIQGNVEPAVLSTVSFHNLVDEYIDLVGWGVNHRRFISPNLRTAQVKVLSNRQCEDQMQLLGQVMEIHERHFCTHSEPFIILKRGDFGGPVIHHRKIIGVSIDVIPDLGKSK